MIDETDTADIVAGQYIDGNLSYKQAINLCKRNGASKAALDSAIVDWRKALGEEVLLKYDIQKGVEVP
jgi:hypothetical protein